MKSSRWPHGIICSPTTASSLLTVLTAHTLCRRKKKRRHAECVCTVNPIKMHRYQLSQALALARFVTFSIAIHIQSTMICCSRTHPLRALVLHLAGLTCTFTSFGCEFRPCRSAGWASRGKLTTSCKEFQYWIDQKTWYCTRWTYVFSQYKGYNSGSKIEEDLDSTRLQSRGLNG